MRDLQSAAGYRQMRIPGVLTSLVMLLLAGCGGGSTTQPPVGPTPEDPPGVDVDTRLRTALAAQNMQSPATAATQDPREVELGRMLFFDKILSTRGDISCSGCHHPTLRMHDAIPLSKGTQGEGLGKERRLFEGQMMVARNATDVFNRGLPGMKTMLWDARVEQLPNGQLSSPAGKGLPSGLSGVLAAQALFAMIDDREMHSTDGMFSPLAGGRPDASGFLPPMPPPAEELTSQDIWRNLADRIRFTPGYQPLIEAAFPDKGVDGFSISDVANALAAFQTERLTTLDTPFDQYLNGNQSALTDTQKEGAVLFYGKAQCSSCHAGPLMTDQKLHNLLVPEIGPGKAGTPGEDRGRSDITGKPDDSYRFRTPPLRNVAETGPYMHNGAIGSLEQVVRHHLDPVRGFRNLDTSHLPEDLRSTVNNSEGALLKQKATLDTFFKQPPVLTDKEIGHLVEFLESLTDVRLDELVKDLEPAEVPSNLSTSYDPDQGPGNGGGPGPDPGVGPEPAPGTDPAGGQNAPPKGR